VSISGKGFETRKDLDLFNSLFAELSQIITEEKTLLDSQWKNPKHLAQGELLPQIREQKQKLSGLKSRLIDLSRNLIQKAMPIIDNLSENLGSRVRGEYCRGIPLRYYATPLGTGNSDARYSLEGIRSLYLAEWEQAVMFERRLTGLKASPPHVHFWIEVKLNNILDLTSERTLRESGIEAEKDLLLMEWESIQDICKENAFTQLLGARVYELGYEGISFWSVRHPETKNIVVFPDNLSAGSLVEVFDPTGEYSNNRISIEDNMKCLRRDK